MDAPQVNKNKAEDRTRVWALFNLNLMFSSIEEETRPAVIERCYWPLLRAAQASRFPIGVAATGYTLATIDRLAPAWTEKLRELIATGIVEPIASGESQLIGPLVPDAVNAVNLRLGNQAYERLLGQRPALVMVSEQCLSNSMIDHYIDAGYRGFVVDWDNIHLANPGWAPTLRMTPCLALSAKGRPLPVLWSWSVALRKLQRLAHGSDDRAAYWHWLDRQLGRRAATLNLYCHGAETFDFRPGHVEAEPKHKGASEWSTIENLFHDLSQDRRIACVRPSDVLKEFPPTAMAPLTLTTAAMPLPTRNQENDNVLRWATTGRDDLGINSRCLALARRMRDSLSATDEDWRELCYLYASDFRTHITARRWTDYRERLSRLERRWNHGEASRFGMLRQPEKGAVRLEPRPDGLISLEARTLGVELDARHGLAIHRLWRGDDPRRWFLGTVPFGHFDDIRLGSDFYSAHLVFQQPGKAQVTDLAPVEAWLREETEWLSIYGEASTSLGPVEKEFRVHRNAPRLDILYRLHWPALPLGVLRLGHLTANPEAFDPDTLWYATHNGGDQPERFLLKGTDFDHGRPNSHQVSASTALGMTEDVLRFGDDEHGVTVSALREQAAVVPLVIWRRLREGFIFRIAFSAGEIDDTVTTNEPSRAEHWPLTLAFSVTLDAAA